MIVMMESSYSQYGQPGSTANPPARPSMPAENTLYSSQVPMKRNSRAFDPVKDVDPERRRGSGSIPKRRGGFSDRVYHNRFSTREVASRRHGTWSLRSLPGSL